MLPSAQLIVAIALTVLLLLILSALLCVRYFQRQTLGDVESGSIASSSERLVHTASNSSCTLETLARSSIENAFSPTGSASPRTLGASVQTTSAAIGQPESTPPSQTLGASAQTTAFAALIPPELCQFTNRQLELGKSSPKKLVRVNPLLQFRLEGQEFEINVDNENEPINSCPKRMDSGKSNKPLIQGIGPVSRVFCHNEIGESIIEKLSLEVDVTILKSSDWVREMSDLL